MLKFKGYIIIDCSEVPFGGNSFDIETGHLYYKLNLLKSFSEQIIQ